MPPRVCKNVTTCHSAAVTARNCHISQQITCNPCQKWKHYCHPTAPGCSRLQSMMARSCQGGTIVPPSCHHRATNPSKVSFFGKAVARWWHDRATLARWWHDRLQSRVARASGVAAAFPFLAKIARDVWQLRDVTAALWHIVTFFQTLGGMPHHAMRAGSNICATSAQ